MAGRTVDVRITGTSAELKAALAEAGLAAEESSSKIGNSFDNASTKAGGAFSKLGQTLENITGIPIGSAFEKSGSAIEGADTKGKGFMGTMSQLGKVAMVAGVVGFAAVAAESVNLAQKFDSTVTSIAANANIPVAAAKKIGDAFLNTAGTTIYSGQEIANAYSGVAGQLGATQGHALNASQAMAVMTAAMDLAEGSGAGLGETTSALSAVLQVYGLKVSDAAHVSDVLFNVSRLTGTGITSVEATLQKLHSTLGAVTPPIGEVGALMLDLAQHGETGRKALSAVNTSLNGLLAPSKSVTAAQQLLGITVFDSSGKFIGMRATIAELQPKLAGMSQEQQLATLKAIGFGSANKALLSTIEAGPGAYDKASAAVNKAGSAHDAAAKQSQTLQHQMETLKATAQDLGTKFGEVLIPKLEAVMKAVEKVVVWFEKHKAVAEALAGVIGGVLLVAIGAFIVDMGAAAVEMIAATWPILAIIAAAAALAFGIYYLSTHWKQSWAEIKRVFDEVVKFLRSGFGDMVIMILGPIGVLVILALHWQAIWSSIRAITNDVWHALHNDVFAPLVNFFTQTIPHALSVVSGAFTSGFQAVHNIVNTVWHAIDNDFVHPLVSFFTNTIPQAISTMVGFFTRIPGQVNHVWSDVINALHGAWSAIANWVMSNVIMPVINFYESIPGRIAHVWSDVWHAYTGAWSAIGGWVYSNVVQPVISFYESIPGRVAHVWSDVWSAIQAVWSAISGWVNSVVVQPVINFFASIPGRITGIASQVWSDFTNGIVSLAGWIDSNVVQPIVGFFTSIPGKLVGIGKTIVSTIVREISGAGGAILGALKSIIPGPLQGAVSSALGFVFGAEGGFFDKPTLAVIGEAGPEVLLPLKDPTRSAQILASALPLMPDGGAGILGGSASLASTAVRSSSSVSSTSSSSVYAPNITVLAQTNANATDIAMETAWALKTAPKVA